MRWPGEAARALGHLFIVMLGTASLVFVVLRLTGDPAHDGRAGRGRPSTTWPRSAASSVSTTPSACNTSSSSGSSQ